MNSVTILLLLRLGATTAVVLSLSSILFDPPGGGSNPPTWTIDSPSADPVHHNYLGDLAGAGTATTGSDNYTFAVTKGEGTIASVNGVSTGQYPYQWSATITCPQGGFPRTDNPYSLVVDPVTGVGTSKEINFYAPP